jgi:large subunit ribosomal protein L25
LEFADPSQAPVAVVEVPRAAKLAAEEAAAATAAPAEGAVGAAVPAATDAPKKEEGKK